MGYLNRRGLLALYDELEADLSRSIECSVRHPYAKHRPSAFAIFSWNLNAPLEPSYFPFTADNSAPKFDRDRTPCQFPRPEQ